MRRDTFEDTDSDDEDYESTSADEDSWDDDDDADKTMVPCPYCRQPVYEDAEYCANCEEYISLEDAPSEQKPVWIVITVILLLSSMLAWIIL